MGEMGGACSTRRECVQNISKKTIALGRPRYRWENNSGVSSIGCILDSFGSEQGSVVGPCE
jgi:hypothetical protein